MFKKRPDNAATGVIDQNINRTEARLTPRYQFACGVFETEIADEWDGFDREGVRQWSHLGV